MPPVKDLDRDDFMGKWENIGVPDNGVIYESAGKKIFKKSSTASGSWDNFGDIHRKEFRARKGMEITLGVTFKSGFGEFIWGCAIDSDSFNFNSVASGGNNHLSFYQANGQSWVKFQDMNALIPKPPPYEEMEFIGNLSLNTYYESKIVIGDDWKATFWFNGVEGPTTTNSYQGKMLRPYRCIYSPGYEVEIDKHLIVIP